MATKSDLRKLNQTGQWSPIDPETMADPRKAHEKLRGTCPVAHSNEWGGFYTLLKYKDIVQASRDYETFTATKQTVIPASPRKGLARLPLQVDPPEHTRYRKALNPYYKEDKVRALTPQFEALCNEIFENCLAEETVDFANQFAAPFTQGTLCILIGLDLDEADRLGELSHEYVKAVQSQSLTMAGGFSKEIDQFAIDLVAMRKANPRDAETDMVSGLLAEQKNNDNFTDAEVAGMVRLALIGGHVVPKNFLTSLAYHLAISPDLQKRLRAEKDLHRTTIEELLRTYAPNQALVRVTTKDTEIGGREIPQGCPVALNFLSANHDEEIFDNPMQFDPERKPNRHLAFGIGPHICIGQAVARLQARLTLEGLLKHTQNFSLAAEPEWARWTEFGIAELTLKIKK